MAMSPAVGRAWFDVPDWFSFENQGAGIAVADLNGSGKHDLLIFQIDGAVDQNQAFYKIGSDLDINGNVHGDWALWQGAPGWFAWENQGGDITTRLNNGKLEMMVMMIDNPPGQNAGYYRMLPLDVNPQTGWTVGIAAVFIPAWWRCMRRCCRPERCSFLPARAAARIGLGRQDFGNVAKGIFTSVVWDPQAAPPGNFAHPPTIFDAHGKAVRFLLRRRHVSAGWQADLGGRHHRLRSLPRAHGCHGLRSADRTVVVHRLNGARPLVSIADRLGRRAHPGRDRAHRDAWVPCTIRRSKSYNPATNKWELHHFPQGFPSLPLYAHLFLLEDGRVFFDGGHMDDDLLLEPCVIDLTHEPLQTTPIFGINARDMRNQSASVILPPAQDQRIMLMGGGPDGKQNKTDAVDNVDIVDFKAAQPRFVAAAPLNLPRLHLNAVLLPDRTVFVTGGSLKQEDVPLARLQSEIYDPVKDEWTLTASCTVPRLYHSTALLLPDGRVVAAGGNPEATELVEWDKDPIHEEMRLEIFSPPYLFKGTPSDDHNRPGEVDLWRDRADRVSRCGEYSLGLSDPKLRHDPFLRYQPAPRRSPD